MQHPTPYTPNPKPYTLHPTPFTLIPHPYTLHPTPYTLHPKKRTEGSHGCSGSILFLASDLLWLVVKWIHLSLSLHQPAESDQIACFKSLGVYRSSPESGDLKCKPGVSKRRFAPALRAGCLSRAGQRLQPWRRYHSSPKPFTLNPAPYTLNPTPYTLIPNPYILHPFTLQPKTQARNPNI